MRWKFLVHHRSSWSARANVLPLLRFQRTARMLLHRRGTLLERHFFLRWRILAYQCRTVLRRAFTWLIGPDTCRRLAGVDCGLLSRVAESGFHGRPEVMAGLPVAAHSLHWLRAVRDA